MSMGLLGPYWPTPFLLCLCLCLLNSLRTCHASNMQSGLPTLLQALYSLVHVPHTMDMRMGDDVNTTPGSEFHAFHGIKSYL